MLVSTIIVDVMFCMCAFSPFRMANARAKAEQATSAAELAKQDSDIARLRAKEIDPAFHQPG